MLQWKQDNYFGYQTTQLMDKQRSKQQSDPATFYDSVIAYTDKCFDMSPENIMVKPKPVEDTVNMAQLYEVFCARS